MSRVDRKSFALPAVLAFVAAICWFVVHAPDAESIDFHRTFSRIATAYKIKVITDPHFPVGSFQKSIQGSDATFMQLEDCASLFASEFSLYPQELVRESKLKSVVFCGSLRISGKQVGGTWDYEHHSLYIDVSYGAYEGTYLRRAIHHEFFHIVDYADEGSVDGNDRWASLNSPGFRYGNGGIGDTNRRDALVLTDKYPGFFDQYATSGVKEDKAEVFSIMIVDPEYVAQRTKQDRVLAAKVRLMKELLIQFCPDINEKFWEKIRKARLHGR